jgi:hypothetical protein
MTSQDSQIPGLTRMFVVNAKPFSGRIEEIPIDSHAVFIAENGSGKTVMIKLLPLFYGEEPRDVVLSHEQCNFFGLYLPTVASYIAFEYVNHAGETRSVIMHSDPIGSALQYRFVRGPLAREMFLKDPDGEVDWVHSTDLESHLRGAGFPVSRRLVTSCRGYRSIIQGAPDTTSSASDRGFHAELAQDYGLGTRKAPLTGIETLMMKMLRNDASLDTLLGIAAGQALENDGGKVSILGRNSAGSLRQWPKDYEGYRRVMALEGAFRESEKVHRRIRTLEEEVGDRVCAIAQIREDLEEQIRTLSEKIGALRAERSDTERSDEEETRLLTRRVSELSSELEALRGRLSRIRADGDRLRKAGGEEAGRLVAEIPRIRSELDAAERHVERISEGGRALAERYEQQRAEVISRFRDEESRLRAEQEAALAKKRDEDDQALQRIDDEATASADRIEARLTRLDGVLLQANSRITDLRVMIAGIGPSEEESGRLFELEAAHEGAATQERSASDALRGARDVEREAHIARERAETREAALRSALSAATEKHRQLADALAPEEGTFQHWLDRTIPDWTGTIGKVIRPDLLSRRGLSPKRSNGDENALFGVELNLDRLDPLMNPDLEARRTEAEKAFRTREQANADLEKGSAELKAAVKGLEAAKRALSEAEVTHQSALRRLEGAGTALDTVKAEIEIAVAARRAGFEAELKEASDDLSTHQADHAAAREELKAHKTRASKVRMEEIGSQKAASVELRKSFSRILEELSGREAVEQARVREAYDAALQDAGLNTDAIAKAEREAADIRKRLRKADDARALAESWGEQIRIEQELPALEARERATVQDLRDASEARSVFISASEARRHKMTQEIGSLEVERERLTGEAASVATILRDHEGAEPARNDHVREGFAVNAAQLGTLKRALRESRDALRARLTEIRSGFRKSGNEAISERLVGLREDEPEAMMADLTNWFETDHHEMLGMLMRGISSMVTPIQTAYNDLVMADREVSAIGRRLRRAIQDMPGFPHVTDVDLTIGSRLRDEPFWADLEAFDGALNAWQAQHDDARSAALVSAMTKLLEHWSDGRDPVIDFRNLLFIEGRLTEKGNERKFSRRTRLSELSSTGNVVILRLILFTALLTVMRQNRRVRFTWAVDEIGQLDPRNTLSLLQMLRANDIALVTAGPGLDPKVVPGFSYHLRIMNGAVYLLPNPNQKAA